MRASRWKARRRDTGDSVSNKPQGFGQYTIGQVVGAVSARYEVSKTKPPERYTQDTLIDDMLNAHKFASSDAERKILRETEGLGTSRTREPTISSLIKRGYLTSTRRGKRHELVSQEMARRIALNVPAYLSSVATTAGWEVAFGMIERGQVGDAAVIAKVHEMLHCLVEDARDKKGTGVLAAGEKRAGVYGSARR